MRKTFWQCCVYTSFRQGVQQIWLLKRLLSFCCKCILTEQLIRYLLKDHVGFGKIFFFLTISYLFSIPKNCPDLKFHCSFEVLHPIGKNIFPGWKKIVLLGKIFFLVGKIIFSIFPHKKTGKIKKIGILLP